MPPRCKRTFLLAMSLLAVAPATGHASTGGAAAAEEPTITAVRCVGSATVTCPAPTTAPHGAEVQIRGAALSEVRTVVFRGRAGRADDVAVRARHVGPRHVDAAVPPRARSGKIELRAGAGLRAVSQSAMTIQPAERNLTAAAAVPAGEQIFPIRGKHDLGQTATNDFGGARDHKGQDLFADCGTPLVVAEGGTVRFAGTQASAGNYAVVTSVSSGLDQVYMHMRAPALVSKGETVTAGQPLGEVGDSGNANGCHLHFELWSAPGWYEGGAPVDPLPFLRASDARDSPHDH